MCGVQELTDVGVIILCLLLPLCLLIGSPPDGAILSSSWVPIHPLEQMLALAIESPPPAPFSHPQGPGRLPWKQDGIMDQDQVWGSEHISSTTIEKRKGLFR